MVASNSGAAGILSNLRIVEIGSMIAGPVACTLLADLGAEVIKVEPPGTGDTLRHIGPFVDDESLTWNVEGRNKKSVTIDLRHADGQKLFKRLIENADAVVENFRPGTLRKWGLDYEQLAEINPRLIMLSISGFGQTGPYAERAAYDRIALAFGGVMHLTGFPDRPPVRFGVSIADYQSAVFGAFSIMTALYYRDAGGKGVGQHIDLALYESVFRFTDALTTTYDKLGAVRQRQGNIAGSAAPGEHFETSDGRFLILTISNNAMFARLCHAMGRDDLLADERFKTHDSRWRNIHDINSIVAAWVKSNDVDVVRSTLNAAGIAFSLTYSIEDIMSDPHYAARGNIVSVPHPRLGPLKMQGVMPRFSGVPSPDISAAPALGEHTAQVLRDLLGIDDDALKTLSSTGVI